MNSHKPFPEILVIGSANADLVVNTPRIPRPGETVLGREFAVIPGGKGANQAVAAARLGATVTFLGRVGDDQFAQNMRTSIRAAGIDDQSLETVQNCSTGVAFIAVDDDGENAICVSPGANSEFTPRDIYLADAHFARAAVCILQLELPIATVLAAIEMAKRYDVPVVLDLAPAPDDPPPALLDVAILSPNQHEAAAVLKQPTDADALAIAKALREQGPQAVVLKNGPRGAVVADAAGTRAIPGFAVKPVDTTAAGDAFTAALATAVATGQSLDEATRFANAAGALACTRAGAQPAMPTRAEVERLLTTHAD
jgi:ribokinase